MSSPHDTIAAIATASGEGAITIVRLSGPDSFAIADRAIRCGAPKPSARPDHSFFRGHVGRASGSGAAIVDEVVVLLFRAPRSYTTEDVVEIQGHGGAICGQRILHEVVAAGARLAEPGEFTRRAFLNGRIDLTQAEAVIDLIRARSERASAAALEQLDGALGREVSACIGRVVETLGWLEASLDFPEDAIPGPIPHGVAADLADVYARLDRLLASYAEGRLIRDGASVPIVGRPNVGKSSIFNCLLGIDRAIVTHIPGTTRDTIEESIAIQGIHVRLIDTAGIRTTGCVIESEGVARSITSLRGSDACICVLDHSEGLVEDDQDVLRMLDPKRTVVVINKMDAVGRLQPSAMPGWKSVACSARTGAGIDEIRSMLINILGIRGCSGAHEVAISDRHRGHIQIAKDAIGRSIDMANDGSHDRSVLIAAELRDALLSMGRVTGKEYDSAVLDSIFQRFCIGK